MYIGMRLLTFYCFLFTVCHTIPIWAIIFKMGNISQMGNIAQIGNISERAILLKWAISHLGNIAQMGNFM